MVTKMFLIPFLYILLIVFTQVAALFLPLFFSFFEDGAAYSAGIFTVSLVTAHLAIFWKGLKSWHSLLAIPLMLGTEVLALQLFQAYGEQLWPHLYAGSTAPAFRLLKFDYGGVVRSFWIQGPILISVAIGLWMGKKHALFVIRRAAMDRMERELLFEFRNRFLPEDELTLFKYETLLSRSLSLVGVRKERIYSTLHSLRIDNTLYIYDLLVDPALKEPLVDYRMLRNLLVREEITSSSIEEAIFLVPDGMKDQLAHYEKMGFVRITGKEEEKIRKDLDTFLAHKFDDWQPFHWISIFMRISLKESGTFQEDSPSATSGSVSKE